MINAFQRAIKKGKVGLHDYVIIPLKEKKRKYNAMSNKELKLRIEMYIDKARDSNDSDVRSINLDKAVELGADKWNVSQFYLNWAKEAKDTDGVRFNIDNAVKCRNRVGAVRVLYELLAGLNNPGSETLDFYGSKIDEIKSQFNCLEKIMYKYHQLDI